MHLKISTLECDFFASIKLIKEKKSSNAARVRNFEVRE